jgi:hypothetical protein
MPRLIAFTQRSIVFLNFGEADWPTLKRGLALLTHSYPDSSEWASRYLVVAYTMKDLEAEFLMLGVITIIFACAWFCCIAASWSH